MKRRRFFIASEREIKRKQTTDVYFARTVKILRKTRRSRRVRAEFVVKGMPEGYRWGIVCGIEECIALLEGTRVDLWAVEEGTAIRPLEPVMAIEANYAEFAELETALLGLLCQASGVATKAARLRLRASDRMILSFGARRMHPAISPMIERSAYIGGCDGVSTLLGAEVAGIEPSGTIPHALVILCGGVDSAIEAFDRYVDPAVRRIALIDTFGDEKFEAIAACEALGKRLYGVRLDTPRSRRGNLKEIVREVKWELSLRGYGHVKIFVSGGIDEKEIEELKDVVDGFGIGTTLSNARVLDFAMDIVEVEGVACAKRGKMSGAKELLRCERCHKDLVVAVGKESVKRCKCGGRMKHLLTKVMEKGKALIEVEPPNRIRKRVIEQLRWLTLD